jgi:group I intron endonuclease
MPRKQYQYHYIYKVTNLINQKYYIGMHSTNNLEDGYMGSGERITRSIKKYGKENFKFEILEMLPNRDLLKKRENEIVNQILLEDTLCMNLVYGGGGGFISPEGVKKGRKKTDEILKKLYGEDFRRIVSKNYYDNLTQTERLMLNEKIKIGLKKSNYDYGSTFRGRKHKEESKKIIGEKNSINQKGEKNSQYGTCWITNGIDNLKIKINDLPLYPEWKKGRTIKKTI